MTGLAERIRQVKRPGLWAAVFFAAYTVNQALLVRAMRPLGTDVLRLQTTFSVDRFVEIVSAWGEAQWAAFAAHERLDLYHPALYALATAFLLVYVFRRGGYSSRWNSLIVLPIVAAVLDWIENVCHHVALSGEMPPASHLVIVAGLCGTVKWVLALGSGTLALGLLVREWARGSN